MPPGLIYFDKVNYLIFQQGQVKKQKNFGFFCRDSYAGTEKSAVAAKKVDLTLALAAFTV